MLAAPLAPPAAVSESEHEARTLAAILELVEDVHAAGQVRAACQALATRVQAYVGCQGVAIGLRRGARGGCRLQALSGVADFDPRSELARWLEAAMDEAVLRGATTAWPPSQETDPFESPAQRQLATLSGVEGVVAVPLQAIGQPPSGAWLFLGKPDLPTDRSAAGFLAAASPALAGALRSLDRAEGGLLRRVWRRCTAGLPHVRGRTIWLCLAALAAAMAIPAPYRISVECEIRPVVRRFVAAPFAGEFERSLVNSGDLVRRNQTLGQMEGREVRWELAGLIADEQRARKSRDANMAAGKTAAAQMDQLEAERIEVKRKLLQNRLEQLAIRSPIDGIVISDDLQRSSGVSVTVGQVLFEVAPLESMIAELAIPDERISHVQTGMPATVRLDAYPSQRWTVPLARIHPRSVTREKDNVFIGEVPLENTSQTLRPGMKGHASLDSGNEPLGWILFHRPWNYLVTTVGW